MAGNIVRTPLDIVDAINLESNSLKAGLGLLYDVLVFDRSNENAVSEAQDQMYFIAGALGDMQKRLERLAAGAEALMRAEKLAA